MKKRNESEETEEIKTIPLYPYLLQGYIFVAGLVQL